MARLAPAHCGTCGFFLQLAGSMRGAFGVCGNELAQSDGRVVSVEHGCGAHSEVQVEPLPAVEVDEPVYDDGDDVELRETVAPAWVVDESGAVELVGAQPGSVGAAADLVPAAEGETEQPHADTGDAGPEPDAVTVTAEVVVEGQQDEGADGEQHDADEGEPR
jgi:hypothetical protein